MIDKIFLEAIAQKSDGQVSLESVASLDDINIDEDSLEKEDASPVHLTIDGEAVKAKYVIGCDGTESRTRNVLGAQMQGGDLSQVWARIDTPMKVSRRLK